MFQRAGTVFDEFLDHTPSAARTLVALSASRFPLASPPPRNWPTDTAQLTVAHHPKNPSLALLKLAKFGNIVGSTLSGIPNQEHSVAPY